MPASAEKATRRGSLDQRLPRVVVVSDDDCCHATLPRGARNGEKATAGAQVRNS